MKWWLLIAVLCASLGFDLWLIGDRWSLWMIPAALAGWYFADMASGFVHMYMDYRPCRPGTGLKELYFWEGSRSSAAFEARQAEVYARISRFERLLYDFKKHHQQPDLFGRHGLFYLVQQPALAVLPFSLGYNLIFFMTDAPAWLIVGIMTMLIGAVFSQYFHSTLHRDERSLIIRLMRRLGLLMTREAHEDHHRVLTRDFAVVSGWSNPVVNLWTRVLQHYGVLRKDGLEPS